MNQSDALIKALLGRGEREVTSGSAQKFRKFTRQYYGNRDQTGNLRPVTTEQADAHWFVSRKGSLRVGRTSSASRRVKEDIKQLLIKEGSTA